MDSVDFDRLARSLVTEASRRRVLAGALSAALGSLVSPIGSLSARADRKDGRGSDKPKDKDPDGGNGHGNGNRPPSNPCEGQADGACCAGKKGEHWCQGGSCVPVPEQGTLTECRGACGTGPQRFITVCGATMSCPFCTEPDGCRDNIFCDGIIGPFGIGSYCVLQTLEVCADTKHSKRQCPGSTQCCSTLGSQCVELRVP
jgi:hypothetical protein